jgi:hypothetical protein
MTQRTPVVTFEPDEEELEPVLQSLRTAMARHPIAFQAGYAALVREGRAFAATPEGASLRAELKDSELLKTSRLVWRTLSLGSFTESSDEILPSTYLDAVLRSCSLEALEPLLSRLFDPVE